MKKISHLFLSVVFIIAGLHASATNTTVNTLASLTSAFSTARPGDTIVVANGTYNWGKISINNTYGSPSSPWIVVKAETRSGVVFTDSTYFMFSGNRIMIDGFRFANGNSSTNAVMAFRTSTSLFANYSRITNITFDNYNSPEATENEWVAFYGVNNRLDHCTLKNKSNARATVVIWYSNANFPDRSVPTFHRIDSNYFAGRSYMGGNGGETIRVGVGNNSRTFGYNVIEYNLFEGMTQAEIEIVSNKSYYNTYRYNTFLNCNGGLTLRMGKYCSVYGNFFINNDPTKTGSYGVRIIDKGHKVYNNYFEGLLGASGSLTAIRCPIITYNGTYPSSDSLNPAILNGFYLPADSAMIFNNTIVNCKGGPGIKLGNYDAGMALNQPLGTVVANNVIKQTTGQAMYIEPTSTSFTYFAEGNLYDAPSGLGVSNTTGFTNSPMTFGSRINGILTAPLSVQDASVNSNNYSAIIGNLDAQGQTRSEIFDAGCDELNGTGKIIGNPLDSNLVGAGRPVIVIQNQTINFPALAPKMFGDADFNPGATSTSGLPVTYTSSNALVATIVNGNIHIVGAGSALITASQAGNTYYAAANNVSQTLIVSKTYVYTPTSATVLFGSVNSGTYGNLATNNSSYYIVNSTTTSTRKVDWYGSVKITQAPSTVSKITVNYDGKNSASKTQVLYLYNWVTAAWVQIDSRTVSTSDVLITYTTTTPANYISSLGEIRLRVYSSAGTSNYTCSGDWMQFAIQSTSTAKNADTGVATTEMVRLYPNPVDNKSVFSYALSNDSKVSIMVYNSNGNIVKVISMDEFETSGVHFKNIESNSLTNGVYFIRLIIQDKQQTIKFIVNH